MKQRSLTGDRPTGKLHLGHFVGSLRNRVALQDGYEQYVMIADMQALTDNAENPQKVRDNILEVALDYLAAGIDPKKSTVFIQSLVPEIAEMTMYFLNLVSVSRLQQNPTVKTEMRQKGFEQSVPAGFLMYPVSQAADILSFMPSIVPVGEDQLPMIEQANEIAEKFNRIYGETFQKVKAVVPETSRLIGIDGAAKMSKSLNNAIYLSDSREEIERKVRDMYTDPGHVHVQDPGSVEGNVVFAYLDIFDPRTDEITALKEQYRKGGLGDVVLKKRLVEVLEGVIAPMRSRREEFAKDSQSVMRMLREGSAHARETAAATMQQVRKAMKIDYYG